MAIQWKQTQHTGVRYREQPLRRFQGKPDRYFVIRYKINGKLKEEALGWASEGWNAQKASMERANLRKAQTLGIGPQTLEEKRRLAEEAKEAEFEERERVAKDLLSFGQYFEETYFPNAKANKKEKSWKREKELFEHWIKPVIAEMPLKDIRPIHLEKIKRNMNAADRAPRTIIYALAVIRQVFRSAKRNGFFQGESPVIGVRKPKVDNERLRFLTYEEADLLLQKLAEENPQLHDIAQVSLHCGLRADEIFSLRWDNVDLDGGVLMILDTKHRNRPAFITEEAREMFLRRKEMATRNLVFVDEKGQKIKAVPKLFRKVVEDLGLNAGVTDRRHKVVFHTLRHTYASWLVQNGEDLYVVKTLMGHSTLAMTERYSHLAADTLKNAVKKFEEGLRKKDKGKVIDFPKDEMK